MIAKRPSTPSPRLVAAVCLVLTFVASLIVFRRSPIAGLDLIVIGSVLSLTLAGSLSTQQRTDDLTGAIPKGAILVMIRRIYSSIALLGVLGFWLLSLPFIIQLAYQLLLFCCFLVIYSVTFLASKNAERVSNLEQKLSESLETLKRAAADCDEAFVRFGDAASLEYVKFRSIKEQIRFLSPSNNPNAVSLDVEMSLLLVDLTAKLSEPTGKQLITNELDRCGNLLGLRKQERRLG